MVRLIGFEPVTFGFGVQPNNVSSCFFKHLQPSCYPVLSRIWGHCEYFAHPFAHLRQSAKAAPLTSPMGLREIFK
jgi:hypothetical protein